MCFHLRLRVKDVSSVVSAEGEWCAFSLDTVRVKGVSGVLSAETQ